MKTITTTSKMKKTLLASSITAAILGLTACGGGGGDDASAPSNVQMSGAVVDDFVAFARVYVDVNNNNQFDSSFEPRAYTDENGYFTVSKPDENGKTINYCQLDPSVFEYKYCLEVNDAVKNGGVIRIETGRDLLTSQVYNATMSLLTNGETSDLKITSVSSMIEQINNINTTDHPGSDQEQLKQDVQTYLNTFLGGGASSSSLSAKAAGDQVDSNRIDPFDAPVGEKERAYKLVIQLNKMVEGISQAFVNSNRGTDVSDFVPHVYRALIVNMDFSNTGLDLFRDLSTKVPQIINRVASTSGKNAPTGSNLTGLGNLNRYLNCVLSDESDTTVFTSLEKPSGESCTSLLRPTTEDNRRNILFAAELATKDNTNQNVLNNSVEIVRTTSNWDYKERDFEITIDEVTAPTFSPNTSARAESFPSNLVFDQHNVTLGDSSDESQFRFFFTKTTPDNVAEGGTFVGCQKDGTGTNAKYNIVNGQYKRDGNRDFIAYMNLVGLTYTFKNIKAGTQIDECTASDNSCLGVSYLDLSGGSAQTKNDYFGNTQTLDQLFKETDRKSTL